MGVADKTRVPVGGVPLLDRTLRSLAGAATVVVVGDERVTDVDVSWAREDPAGGGPAAAVSAGLSGVTADVVVLLAGDLPSITRDDIEQLVDAVNGDGAVYVDDADHEQWLCSAWRTAALRRAAFAAGASLRAALSGLDFARLKAPASIIDCDTPQDLARAEESLR